MSLPTNSQVHVNGVLTDLAIKYLQNANLVATRLFPIVPVTKQSDRYYIFDKQYWRRSNAKKRAPGTEAARTGYKLSTQPYYADVYAVKNPIPNQTRANADAPPLNLQESATQLVTNDLIIKREVEFASEFFTTSKWTGSSTGSDITPSVLWSATGSTPIEDIRAQCRAMQKNTGFKPNKLLLGPEVYDILVDHPHFLDRVKHSERGVMNAELMASILDLQEVLIGDLSYDSAPEGATASNGFAFGKNALLVHAPSAPSIDVPSAGYHFTWNDGIDDDASVNPDGIAISDYYVDAEKSWYVEGEMAFDPKLTAADLGVFFSGAVA